MKRKRRLLPKPPSPPTGWMWWHGDLKKIRDVERHCRGLIGNHDKLPRAERDRANGIVKRFKLSKGKPRW
jgi:hypothetical protein